MNSDLLFANYACACKTVFLKDSFSNPFSDFPIERTVERKSRNKYLSDEIRLGFCRSIRHFTVKDGSEADGDLVLIQTFLLYHVNQFILMLTSIFQGQFPKQREGSLYQNKVTVSLKIRNPDPDFPIERTLKLVPNLSSSLVTQLNNKKHKKSKDYCKADLKQRILFL